MQAELQHSSHELSDYFKAEIQHAESEVEILGSVVIELLQSGKIVNNKAMITQILLRMESTSDVVALDGLRHVLEMVVHQTEDDLIA